MTEIKDMKDLTFSEEGHIYKINGMVIPSVTTLMNPLSDQLYGTVSADVLNKAAKRGTAVHEAIEMYNKYGIVEIEPEYSRYFDAFERWYSICKPTPLASEYSMYHKTMLYAGTADAICEISGNLVLIDYKTTSTVNKMLTGVQLEAYAQALKSHGITVDSKAIVHLKANGKYDVTIYEPEDTECWNVFVSLLTIHNYKSKFLRR